MCSQEPEDGTEGSVLAAFAKRAAQLRLWGKAAGQLGQELGQQQVSGVAHLPCQDLASQSQAQALPLLGEGGEGGSPSSLTSTRQAASPRDFQYSPMSTSRQRLTPVEKQNRDKTAIFKSKGLHFWEQVPGLQLGRNSLDPPYAPQKKAESRTDTA